MPSNSAWVASTTSAWVEALWAMMPSRCCSRSWTEVWYRSRAFWSFDMWSFNFSFADLRVSKTAAPSCFCSWAYFWYVAESSVSLARRSAFSWPMRCSRLSFHFGSSVQTSRTSWRLAPCASQARSRFCTSSRRITVCLIICELSPQFFSTSPLTSPNCRSRRVARRSRSSASSTMRSLADVSCDSVSVCEADMCSLCSAWSLRSWSSKLSRRPTRCCISASGRLASVCGFLDSRSTRLPEMAFSCCRAATC
mmetsp:Transcript_14567/g.38490  ORF Transcript_14567/g.38490 Transcript_14567/m.38490 type:complete len:252 (-) Transcript_14567:343-1098(-)